MIVYLDFDELDVEDIPSMICNSYYLEGQEHQW